jgi:hypothetical protein
MKPRVEQALAELESAYPGWVRHEPDDDGGAFVLVDKVALGDRYLPQAAWIAFHITWTYDEGAEVYPHFLDATVRYVGEGATPNAAPSGVAADRLPAALSRGFKAPGFDLDAIQVSRRSNTPDEVTALEKLARVVDFLRTR